MWVEGCCQELFWKSRTENRDCRHFQPSRSQPSSSPTSASASKPFQHRIRNTLSMDSSCRAKITLLFHLTLRSIREVARDSARLILVPCRLNLFCFRVTFRCRINVFVVRLCAFFALHRKSSSFSPPDSPGCGIEDSPLSRPTVVGIESGHVP